MGDIVELENSENQENESADIVISEENGIIPATDDILNDISTVSKGFASMSMPVSKLAALGAGVSSLIPALQTVTQTTTFPTEGLYQIINAAPGDVLKMSKSKDFAWGAIKTASGASKMASLLLLTLFQ